MQNIFTAVENIAVCIRFFWSLLIHKHLIQYAEQRLKEKFLFVLPMLSFPDIWPKNWPVSVNWISSSAPWINAATQTLNKLIFFGFQPLISSPALHTKQTLEFDLFLQCSVWASAGFTKKRAKNWQCGLLYFISSVFTVTMTALTFRKNSHWLVLPFVRLLLGTNRHDCNQTFFYWIHAL